MRAAQTDRMNLESKMNRLPKQGEPNARPSQEVVIEPARGWSALRLGDLWTYRDLFYFMVWRDLRTRYRQTALGPLWIIINPLFNMVIYTIIFGVIAQFPSGDVPYQVFTYCALLPWDTFSNAVNSGSSSLLGNSNLISKIYFPRLLLPFSRIISSLVDFCVAFIILVAMLIFYRILPNAGVVFLPFFLFLGIITGLGLGLWFSGVIVKYRDFGQVTGYMVRALMYLSPVVYSSSIVPANLQTIYHLNPMANVIDGFRWALLNEPAPDLTLTLVSTVIALGLCISGLYLFRRVERSIVDIA